MKPFGMDGDDDKVSIAITPTRARQAQRENCQLLQYDALMNLIHIVLQHQMRDEAICRTRTSVLKKAGLQGSVKSLSLGCVNTRKAASRESQEAGKDVQVSAIRWTLGCVNLAS